MRLATFNIESLDLPPRATHPIAVRAAVLRPLLERLDADVLCLQEVNGQHVKGRHERVLAALDAVLEGTRYEHYTRAATHGGSGTGVADVHNLVTLSRFPIAGSDEVRYRFVTPPGWRAATSDPPQPEPVRITFERPLLTVDLDVGGRLLTVVNLHLRAPLAAPIPGQKLSSSAWRSTAAWAEGAFVSGLKRSAQALECRLLVDSLLDADIERMIAVAGDFNAEDHDTALRLLVAPEEETGRAELAARSLVVLDRALPADRRWSMRFAGRADMPDHILASQALHAHFRGIEVLNETLDDAASDLAPAGSSHAPLVASFAL